jgi:ABC-type bacteriocin/lantibiotic exporter with double-glycine peptidase domain
MARLYAFLLCLVFTLPTSAQQIKIGPECDVPNVGHGYCGHCCIETIARYYKYTQAYDRVQRLYARWGDDGGGMTDEEVCQALDEYGMHYLYRPHGTYQYELLTYACQNGLPSIINWKPIVEKKIPGHYIILVGYYTDEVAVIDSNRPRKVRWYTRAAFEQKWSGDIIMVYPK